VVAGCRGGQARHLHHRSVAAAQACLACWRAAATRWDGDSRCSRDAHGTCREAPGRTGTGWDDPTAYAQLEGVVEARRAPASTARGQFRSRWGNPLGVATAPVGAVEAVGEPGPARRGTDARTGQARVPL
jgi:hypothetical protein